uniref:NADH-ubiquinone oxidoreductase chain 6 n=1 Tax=Beybienkoa kurandanensis TaxID=2093483 RepID=A0A2P1H937_9NEOP|nr:NADH dehydrogenase subunit 6 [Beybienkoa kurandanensis]
MLLMASSMITSIMFTQMNHPLAMGLMLLLQTMLISLISGMMSQSFWFSYILFLIFLGGMLILFIYVTSLASNEMFSLSTKMISTMLPMMILSTIFLMYSTSTNSQNQEMQELFMLPNPLLTSLIKLYNQPTSIITIMLASYLFLTLIVVVKIINISKGPLRQMY